MYNIISKIEIINNEMKSTEIGFSTDQTLVDEINNIYYQPYEDWIIANREDLENQNIDIKSFFETTPVVYSANHFTTCIEGMELTEITNINEI